jgi:hypothetical protein
LWRVRATAVGIGAAISLSARTGPRWAIVYARRCIGVVGRAVIVGATETVRRLSVIGRVALCAPAARVVGRGLIAVVDRSVVLHAHVVIASG